MSLSQALSAAGLIRPTRLRGFCPACRVWETGTADEPRRAEGEISPPALTALALLVLAAVAWALTIARSRSTGEMAMGHGSLESFAINWVVMMAAMMLPSALPLVYEFARRSEGRRGRQTATGVLATTYLSMWLAFGLAGYFVRNAIPVPQPHESLVGGLALVLAGLYGLTPIKSASEARCRELCALHGPLPFNLVRSALVVGAGYGLSCVGCSAGLMMAMAIIGMTNLGWVVILTALILVYKLAPAPNVQLKLLMSVALVAMAVVYALMA